VRQKKQRGNDYNLAENIAYDRIAKDDRDSNLAILYDEVNILLFEKPRKKPQIKKVE
jgi:hypothetical protein